MGRARIAAALIVALLATSAEAQSGRRSSRTRAKSTARAGARAIVIDHSRIEQANQVSPATRAKFGQMAFYFAHASVGGNILKGLAALHKEDPQRYPLTARDARGGPSEGGVVYQESRGNPGWRGKVEHFRQSVDQRWHGPGLVALDKFCYVDPDADADVYLESMLDLSRRHPETVFVLATIPLKSGADRDNVRRQVFNEQVRRFARERGAVLLDIADIESHDPAGRPMASGNGSIPTLFDGYTHDGGHLNAEGARRVALGFYALAAALAERDAR